MQLYPYQSEGVSHLLRRRCVLLADEMGLGKTVQASDAIRQLFEAGSIRRVLIVCPTSLSRNWRQEIKRWTDGISAVLYEGPDRFGLLGGNARVLIGSYETVVDDLRRVTGDGALFHDAGLDLIILDEAQRIKEPESLKSRVLCKVVAARRWAITGTPLENHPKDLFSILRFLFPNDLSYDIESDDLHAILALRDLSMIRRTKSEVGLQLPPKTVATIPVELTPDQAAEYEQTRCEIIAGVTQCRSRSSIISSILAGLQRLRRIAVISENGESNKIDFLCEEIPDIVRRGEKVIIFSSFPNIVLPYVMSRLVRYGPLLYSGSMSSEERSRVHEQFLIDPRATVMCASLRAAGVGLTWTVASHVYHTDVWWNPQVLRQSEDRVHRIGQNKPVYIRRIISEDTIESAIEDLLSAKQEIFDAIIEEKTVHPAKNVSLKSLMSLIEMKSDNINCDVF